MRRILVNGMALMALAIALGLSGIPHSDAAAETASVEAAEVRTASFAVENMTCALCPVTVKAAMEGVDGVQSVEIDFEAKTAVVRFDPSVTTADEIAAASANAGYPAAPRE